jgi:hypothetical protein
MIMNTKTSHANLGKGGGIEIRVLMIKNRNANKEDKSAMTTPQKVLDKKRRKKDGKVEDDSNDDMGLTACLYRSTSHSWHLVFSACSLKDMM